MIDSEDFCGGDGSGGGDGELVEIYVAPLNLLDIKNPVVIDGLVDDIPWLTPNNPWELIKPVEEDEANSYEEVYNDTNEVIAQTSIIKVLGVNRVKLEYLQTLQRKCALAIMLIFSSGRARLQGLDSVFSASGWQLIPTLSPVSLTQSTNKSSTTITDYILINFKSVARNYAMYLNNYEEMLSKGYQEIVPSVILNLIGTSLQVIWTGEGVRTLSINVGGVILPLSTTANVINLSVSDLAWFKHSGAASSTFAVTATIAGPYGAATVVKQIPTKRTRTNLGSRIYNINNIDLAPTEPFAHKPTVVANIVRKGALLLNGWHPETVRESVNLFNNGINSEIPDGYDLTNLCGTITTNTDSIGLASRLNYEKSLIIGSDLIVPIIKNIGNQIISINGVACAGLNNTLPEVSLSLSGSTLNIVWNDGGDMAAVKSLKILTTNDGDITLDETQTSIDLGLLLYGQEHTGASTQSWSIEATITNTEGSATASTDLLIHTESWSGGRFVYAVNSTEAPAPTFGEPIFTGNQLTGYNSLDIGIWKYFLLEIRFNRKGTYSGTSIVYDDGFSAVGMASHLCGYSNPTYSQCFLSSRFYGPISGLGTFTNSDTIPHTVDGGNLITSINGVSC